ncbi:MAG: amino acid permease [Lachnospiraceae bacterium]|nr:amino acid permease [Lachnospiraceae bacterium]
MRESVTLTVGSVVGVGLFVTGANVAGLMGNAVIIATLVALLVTIYPALLYAEMGAALPYAGGTYQYATAGLSRPVGFLAGWSYIITMVSVSGAEALSFAFYFKTLFSAFGVSIPISDTVIACLILVIFVGLNVWGIEMTGRVANATMFFFWGIAIVWFIMMIPNIQLPNFVETPDFLSGGSGNFIANVAMIWWCFAGFEACCSLGEEIRYPHINIPRAMFLTPFIIFAVNALFQWFLVGIVPTDLLESLATASAPYAEAMTAAGILGIPLAMLAAGIAFGGGLSTMNASISTPPRYLFAMARDGGLPKVFTRVHSKYKTPYVAILFLGGLTFLLVLTNSMDYIASLSLFADLFTYVIGIAAALGLRKKMPELDRPYQAPGIWIGAPVSILIYLIMMTQLEKLAVLSGIIWCILGMFIYWGYTRHHKNADTTASRASSLSCASIREEPEEEDSRKMDREYLLWKRIVIIAVILALALYIVPYIIV